MLLTDSLDLKRILTSKSGSIHPNLVWLHQSALPRACKPFFRYIFHLRYLFHFFQIEFDTHVARSLQVVPKEMPTVQEHIAMITENPEVHSVHDTRCPF